MIFLSNTIYIYTLIPLRWLVRLTLTAPTLMTTRKRSECCQWQGYLVRDLSSRLWFVVSEFQRVYLCEFGNDKKKCLLLL